MKPIFSFFLTFILILSSCSTTNKATVLKSPTTNANNQVEVSDYLIYLKSDHPNRGQLILYDPVKQTRAALLPSWDIDGFSISTKNRLAFSAGPDEKKDIFILDYPFTQNAPMKLTQNTDSEVHLLLWSPDGRYLAYETVQADGKTLFVWDGTTATPIYHYTGSIGELTWSVDGRLAFYDYDGVQYEILIWDGNTIANVSQNPSGSDCYPAWSADGQLAFLSCQDEACDIYVWDGQSTNNGIPDTNTFTNVAPKLTGYYSQPVWTSSGSLSFIAFGPNDKHAQVFEWNGQTATNISQNPDFHNGGQRWRSDGYWAFVTFFSSGRILYVRNAENQTLLKTKAEQPPAWSQGGLLMFCLYERPEWVLSMWNGTREIEVARGNEVRAQWNNGAEAYCSSG